MSHLSSCYIIYIARSISMANSGPNSNNSQFILCPVACPWLNGKHVVFGHVTAGMEVLKAMGYVGSTKCSGKPVAKICIVNCGQLGVLYPFVDRALGSVANDRTVVKVTEATIGSNHGKPMTKQIIVADCCCPVSQLYPAVVDNAHLPAGRVAKTKPWYLCCTHRWWSSDSEGNMDGSDYVKLLD